MTESSDFGQGSHNQPAEEAVRTQLERILSSSIFMASPSLSQFLHFVVTETLAGRAEQIKAYTIAIKAWERERDFDPQTDPIVRIQAGRLRRALREYYSSEGVADSIRIELPKGAYVPRFVTPAVFGDEKEAPIHAAEIEPQKPAVAVLPFQNLSSDEAQALFVDGFSEELAIYLSRFQALTVIAYYSCRRFRDTAEDVRVIGQQLGADFIVTGAIYRDEARLRLSAALNHAHEGIQLWGEQFDRELTAANLYDVQDEIVEQIVAAIGSRYGVIPRVMAEASLGKRTDDLSVYEAILSRTTFLMNVTPDAHWETTRALERAVRLDPACALAWAGLGGMYAVAYILGLEGYDDLLGQALDCANRALRLDPLCQDAFGVLANVYFHRRDRDGVVLAIHRMLELNPNDATFIGTAGFWLALAGYDGRGLAYLDKAIALNPFFPGWFHIPYFLHHFVRGEHDQAYVRAQRINMPEFFWDPMLRAVALSRMERIDEAQAALRELLQLKPDFTERALYYLGMLVMPDDLQRQVLDSLHEAGLPDMV